MLCGLILLLSLEIYVRLQPANASVGDMERIYCFFYKKDMIDV